MDAFDRSSSQVLHIRSTKHIMHYNPFLQRLLFVLLIGSSAPFVRGQGCSDAGVCTAGPIGELQMVGDSAVAGKEYRNLARLTFSYGVGEQGTTIVQVVPEIGIGITERWGVQLKVPYVSASGNLGSNSGLGDPTLTTSYGLVRTTQRRLDVIVGAKFPANKADAKANGEPLPMPYQTSLGTTDLLFGLNYKRQRFSAAIAYQHVLDQNNLSAFDPVFYPSSSDAAAYFGSFHLKRANDLVVRGQYVFKFGDLLLQPGLLAIQHLAKDQSIAASNGTEGGRYQDIAGSDGLTLNLTADARYAFNDQWALELAMGTPLVVRDVRPDGLTRSLVLNVGLRYAF